MSRLSTNTAEQLEPPTETSLSTNPGIEERMSRIHGRGVYALKPFRAGERIIELLGERISAEESDRRAELLPENGHTFFFWVDDDLVLDCGVNGNSARYINHHCEPNCEAVIEDDRVFIDAIRDIAPGEELTFDYNLCWYGTETPEELALYACRCGAERCRGTMLAPEPLDEEEEEEESLCAAEA
jgi:SET domain-containing protein